MSHAKLVDAGDKFAEDPDWLRDVTDHQFKIIWRAAKIVGIGVVLFLALSTLSLVSKVGYEGGPAVSLTLGQGEAFAAFGILIAFTSLLVPVSVSLSTRIRSDDDKELALFIQPIILLATLPGLLSPTIALALISGYGINQIHVPSLAGGISAVAFIAISCAWVVEILGLGEKFHTALADAESTRQARRRERAAKFVTNVRLDPRRQSIRTRFFLLVTIAVILATTIWVVTFLLNVPSLSISLLALFTMLVSIFSTYLGQVSIRRGNLIDATFLGLAFAVWFTASTLAILTQPTISRVSIAIGMLATCVIVPIFLMSRRVERSKLLSLLSLRTLIGWKLRKDAQSYLSPNNQSTNRNSSARNWYSRMTGDLETSH